MEKHIHGGDVYHHQGCIDFSANCNPLGTPEGIKKAIIKSLEHINDYPQVGCTPLKKAIAEYENTKPDQVICGNGMNSVISESKSMFACASNSSSLSQNKTAIFKKGNTGSTYPTSP